MYPEEEYRLLVRSQTVQCSAALRCPYRYLVQRVDLLTALNISARLGVGHYYADALYVTPCLNIGTEYALRSTEDQQIHDHEGVDKHEWYCSCVSTVIPV